MKRKNRFGERHISSDGFLYIIKEYRNSNNVEIIFEDGTIKNTNYFNISHNCIIKNKNIPNKRNMKAKASFIERVNKVNPDIEVLGEYTKADQKILVKCKKCGYEWKSVAHNLLNGHGCQKCQYSSFILTEDKFKEKAAIANPDVFFKTFFQGRDERITAAYPCGHEYTLPAKTFLTPRECPECKKQYKHMDDEGNLFSTIKKMCKAHNISTTSYYNKKNKGIIGSDLLVKSNNCGRPKKT